MDISLSTKDRITIYIHGISNEQLAQIGKSGKDINLGEGINFCVGEIEFYLFPKGVQS